MTEEIIIIIAVKHYQLTSVFGCVDVIQLSPTNNGILVAGLKSNSGTSHEGVLLGSNASLANLNSEEQERKPNKLQNIRNKNENHLA